MACVLIVEWTERVFGSESFEFIVMREAVKTEVVVVYQLAQKLCLSTKQVYQILDRYRNGYGVLELVKGRRNTGHKLDVNDLDSLEQTGSTDQCEFRVSEMAAHRLVAATHSVLAQVKAYRQEVWTALEYGCVQCGVRMPLDEYMMQPDQLCKCPIKKRKPLAQMPVPADKFAIDDLVQLDALVGVMSSLYQQAKADDLIKVRLHELSVHEKHLAKLHKELDASIAKDPKAYASFEQQRQSIGRQEQLIAQFKRDIEVMRGGFSWLRTSSSSAPPARRPVTVEQKKEDDWKMGWLDDAEIYKHLGLKAQQPTVTATQTETVKVDDFLSFEISS
jgi:hypothetical protein